ncbi:MAG: hypothetical protein UR85_C0003G0015 [Candidatus Nomurabacteria bacterium GW2011_GWF2_35_66]|uniref:Baseplate protein J-like domain-containing protein n=1 Tax=Candidatus Nomurabacteria bacterium GW2011_GWE1_35_16 TaxID=1618761 RepID=A0A0G0B8N8_9BACT|nr:MAG: hypothetical protein UR55_C0005G0015 [Candidatus Nomurabacteria bacterium GW2011_GWF1_34_20]KKP63343.1 MAG: hypothetical protein UR57_C0005G0015 [Candidatus Nomurabacteria bacterium GW2011_GWE2_34_25]KKP65744.1 MAG: hypothetical protein UR64_C0019G0008 [Candidatus Nomurabacteria bacterium GW2011_GWE1_35_16]KKP83580.1 MAG: hypothetical protein UR85_C0003G0015 [Candidatus Nomurabacteria bacterium GW2011_GWF2_35_66]HAE36841.1 hypothetical protein [Candidatus Nomurabacteria bacterium]
MNRKILEDVKINHIKKIIHTPQDDVGFKDVDNHNPTRSFDNLNQDQSSKYDFLNKKNNNTSIYNKRISVTPQMPSGRRPFNRAILFIFIISFFVGVLYLLSTFFLMAKVTIVAKNNNFELKHQKFNAGKMKPGVPFELMIVSDSEYRDVVLTNAKEVSDKAKGDITLYNEYNTKAQKIVAGTFVADEKGKTYKTNTTVSIPGYTLDKSKNIIPGQISVGVTAFLHGDAYNGNPESFYISSFKGTDKYKKIYGKAKTSINGGMTGLVYLLGNEEKEDLLLKTASFKEKLIRKLSAQVPADYILYPDAVSFSYEFGENLLSKTPDAKIEMKGTLSAFLLKENGLSDSIISKLLPGISSFEKSEIIGPNLSNLSFRFTDKSQMVNKDIENFEFELTGNLPLSWNPNVELLKGLLVNKPKSEVSKIFKQDPGIVSATVSIMPFWSKILPKDIKNINIIIKKFDEK